MSSHRGTPRPQNSGGTPIPNTAEQHALFEQFANEAASSGLWPDSMAHPQGTGAAFVVPSLTLRSQNHEYDFGETTSLPDRLVDGSSYGGRASNATGALYTNTTPGSQNLPSSQLFLATLENTIEQQLQEKRDPRIVVEDIGRQYPKLREQDVVSKVMEIHNRIAPTYWTTSEDSAFVAQMKSVDGEFWPTVAEGMERMGWSKRPVRAYIEHWDRLHKNPSKGPSM